MGWMVRAETDADYGVVGEIHRAAFGRDDEARLVSSLRGAPGFVGALSLVAEVGGAQPGGGSPRAFDGADGALGPPQTGIAGGTIVGHALLTPIRIRSEVAVVAALALAPMAVRPDCQRQGVGASLVRVGIDRSRELGHTGIIVLGHRDYYPRFGFVPASRFGIRAPFAVPDGAFMALPLRPGALDGCAGVVEYPPAFQAAS